MALVVTDNQWYHKIADAIREKGGTTRRYRPSEMEQAVLDIYTPDPVANFGYVNFMDEKGQYVGVMSKEEIADMTQLPTLPRRDGLLEEEWNWAYGDVKNADRPLLIGATFTTDDGYTHIYLDVSNDEATDVTLNWWQNISKAVIIDWGDGSSTERADTVGASSLSHNYPSRGSYKIVIRPSWGSSFRLGGGTQSTSLIEGSGKSFGYLKRVHTGQNLTGISDYGLYYEKGLECVTLNAGVANIGTRAFMGCTALKSIVLPKNAVVGESAFRACTNLTDISWPGAGVSATNDSAFVGDVMLRRIELPSNIETISASAFNGDTGIGEVTIPANITRINANAFLNCSSILAYHVKATTPPTLAATNVFSGINRNCRILVPPGTVSTYKRATNWNVYADYMEADQ